MKYEALDWFDAYWQGYQQGMKQNRLPVEIVSRDQDYSYCLVCGNELNQPTGQVEYLEDRTPR